MAKELKPQPASPECERLAAVSEESNKIGSFLDWMQSKGLVIASYDDDGYLYSAHISINHLLAEYYEIDLDKVEQERRALLDWVREVQS